MVYVAVRWVTGCKVTHSCRPSWPELDPSALTVSHGSDGHAVSQSPS